jgi:ElaB/YqjD/DUF883 family membrane-anchored ribosome-binding protein
MSPTTDSNEPAAEAHRPLRDGIDTMREKAHDAAELARTKAYDTAELAREKARAALDHAKDGIGQARETIGETYTAGRGKAVEAYAAAREKAKSARQTATGGVDTSPITALSIGIALGAVIGALLPRTERETKMLGAVGARMNGVAQEAVGAARDAGKDKLAEFGLSPDKARETMRSLIDGALAAAASAGTAAAEKAREGTSKTTRRSKS